MAKKKNNMDELLNQGTDLIEFYRNHPCTAAYELLGVDFAPIQRLVFRDMWFKNYVIGVCSRGFGKTFMLGTLAALSALLYPGNRIGLIGPVFRQSFAVSSINSSTYGVFWTSKGLVTGAQSMYDNAVPCLSRIQSVDGQNTILSKWLNDDRACINIKTTKGFELPGSIDHSVLVLDDCNKLKYKELQDINKNDYIVIRKGFNYFGNNNSMPRFDEFEHDWRTKDCLIPNEVTTDLAYWMGLLMGDGCVSVSKNKRKQRVNFVSEDQDLLDSFENYLREYFLVDKEENIRRENRKNNTWQIEYYCKKLIQYFLKCGFTKTTALDKKVPDIIKKSSREIFVAFLQGLFDTDGCIYIQKHSTGSHCEVTFNTSSVQLSKEVHAILLNLGIISNLTIGNKACVKQLSVGNKPSKCSEAYKIRITGQENIIKFNNYVGFRSIRKEKLLNDFINDHFKWPVSLAKSVGLPYKMVNKNREFFKQLVADGIYFVKLKDKDYFFSDTFDIEVENEHCYFASGFINHNSKMIFNEVEKLYDQSSILREATAKRPTRGSDTCYLKFKSVSGKTPSYIEALPLGDGNKIRGSRFYLILVDELAQVPDQTLDMVLRPMGATSLAPMERVRRLEEQKRLIDAGLAVQSDFQEEKVNKMIMTSSGYYKFNHMWRRMQDHWRMMAEAEAKGEKSPYSVWQVPYYDLPEGFLDKENIHEAKRIMSVSEYSMEYEAAMVSDSEGFFKASLLEECTLGSGFSVEMVGDSSSQYIIGIDPNQGGKASTGVVIVKLGKTTNRVVNVLELKKKTTQQLTTIVQDLCDKFNIIRIFMDKGGGGKAICDLLEEGYGGYEPIIDRTNDEHRHLPGRHILDLVNFSTAWISDANFTTKSMVEAKELLFPDTPTSSTSDLEVKAYDKVTLLKSQMLSIVVTQTANGSLHFDTPTKSQNKDLYSAIILAAHGARMLSREIEGDGTPILHGNGGLIRMHNQSGNFNNINYLSGAGGSNDTISAAILKKKIK